MVSTERFLTILGHKGDKRAGRLEGKHCRVRRFDAPNGRGNLLKCLKVEGLNGINKRARGLEGLRDSLLTLNSYTSIPLYLHTSKRRSAFTMAEILVSLTIIGIIAAITLPSLIGNIKEKSWDTQRKVLYSRISQAIGMLPSLNGYGATGTQDEINQKAAQAFISDGLSTVLQINNICDSTKLSDCGIPEKITVMGTNSKMNFPTNLTELNPMFTSTYSQSNGQGGYNSYYNPQRNINTNVAAFETKNGESVAVFYNPYCQPDMGETSSHYSQPKMCADFVYDLNGRKGPNKVGKDIGFITALYPTDSEIVMPIPSNKKAENDSSMTMNFDDAKNICKAKFEDSHLPNIYELMAMFYNKKFLGDNNIRNLWSVSLCQYGLPCYMNFPTGARYYAPKNNLLNVWCIKR